MENKQQSPSLYFYVYPSALQNVGGGEVLLLKTKEYLEHLGVQVKLFDMWHDRLKAGDLLHVFGSVKEALGLMEVAKDKGVQIVHSPIIWYNWQSSCLIPYRTKHRVMSVIRQIAKTLLPQVPSGRGRMMRLGDIVLGASEAESKQIHRYFKIPKQKIKTVTYGADERFGHVTKDIFEQQFGLKNFILTVGRIEPRKNQLQLIKAVNKLECDLVIVGKPVSSHMDYFKACKRAANDRVHFIGGLDMDSDLLASAVNACSVFVLGSWFETPGLAALEAGLAGKKVVITCGGPTNEYFKHFVSYVNPASVSDIRLKLKRALKQKETPDLQNHIQNKFLWKHTAEQTLHIYESLGFKHQGITSEVLNE